MSPKLAKADELFPLLSTQATHLVEASAILSRIIEATPEDRPPLNSQLHAVENSADEACHTLLQHINQSFILPYDREDLYALASAVDDCVDLIDEAGDNIVLYKPESLPAGVADQVAILRECAARTVELIGGLKKIEKGLHAVWIDINDLENQGDKLYRSMIADLFEGDTDALEVMKIQAILEALEGATDSFEAVSSVVASIAIKEA